MRQAAGIFGNGATRMQHEFETGQAKSWKNRL